MSIPVQFVTAPFGLEPLTAFALRTIEGADGLHALVAEPAPDAPGIGEADAEDAGVADGSAPRPSSGSAEASGSGAEDASGSSPDEVRLFVLDAAVHLPDYSPVLDDEQTALLGLTDAADALLLVVANPAADGLTVNLLAPIVVNRRTSRAAQLILDGQDFPLRAVLQRG